MAFQYIEYKFPIEYALEKIIWWADSICRCYFALKAKDSENWSYYSGNASHNLEAGEKLTSAASSTEAETNYLRKALDSSNKAIAVLPSIVMAKYVRIYIDDSNDNPTQIYEFRPSVRIIADEIITGDLKISDDFTSPPLITVTASDVDRIKIGNYTGSTYGIVGYDETATKVFELSNVGKSIAGWDFTSSQLTKNDIIISSAGKIKLGSSVDMSASRIIINSASGLVVASGAGIYIRDGGDILLSGKDTTGDKATLVFTSNIKIGSTTTGDYLGIWNDGNASDPSALVIGGEPHVDGDIHLINTAKFDEITISAQNQISLSSVTFGYPMSAAYSYVIASSLTRGLIRDESYWYTGAGAYNYAARKDMYVDANEAYFLWQTTASGSIATTSRLKLDSAGKIWVYNGPIEFDLASGDPVIIFDTDGADKFTIGVDDTDTDNFRISAGGALDTTAFGLYLDDTNDILGLTQIHTSSDGATTGTMKVWIFQDDDMADDATVALPTGVQGMVLANAYVLTVSNCRGIWNVISDGTCNTIAGTGIANSDSDGNLCVYDTGAGVTLKNRLGGVAKVRCVFFYF